MDQSMDRTMNKVWETIHEMNQCWTQGKPEKLAEYFHEDMVAFTPIERELLDGRKPCIGGFQDFVKAARILHWKESDPKVQVYGDAAVVTYYYEISYVMEGKTVLTGGRDMHFLVKLDGKWWIVAEQFSNYPRFLKKKSQ